MGLKISLFFITYSYKAPLLIALEIEVKDNSKLPARDKIIAFMEKIKEVIELCQVNIINTTKKQEDSANKLRTLALVY